MSEFQPPDPPEMPNPADEPAGRTFADRALWNAYAEGRADEREDFRTLVQQTLCVRDGWHPFTALALQAELLAALDDA
jgi:hypothetical protein